MLTSSLLFPTTDAGVAIQVLVLIVLTVAGVWRFRHNKDIVLFVLGLFMVAAAFFGVRAVH